MKRRGRALLAGSGATTGKKQRSDNDDGRGEYYSCCGARKNGSCGMKTCDCQAWTRLQGNKAWG